MATLRHAALTDGTPLPFDEGEAYRSVMRFQVLGPLEVSRDGEIVALGGPKQRLVLAHLVIRANEVVSADLLIDEIWGEQPPEAARGSLHAYVSNLKKALGPELLHSRPPGYVLRAPVDDIDANRFASLVGQARRRLAGDPAGAARALREALGLWHGEPLADLADELSLQPEIERLSELRLGAIEDRLDAELTLGRHNEIVPELERLAARHPLRERICGQLLLALYRTGRQAEALAAYHRLRAALDEQLGLEPSPAIEQLQHQILNHDPALDLHGAPLRGYRLVEQIGAGPVGVVQRAFEPQTERELAIKVLGAAVANDAAFIRRFDTDARRVARLEHPHIAPLYDWWREPDAAYLVTRLLRGGSLAQRLSRGQAGSTIALKWTEQLAAALTAAHRQGVVHGDLRPGNVLFDTDDNAYLADFAVGYDPASAGSERRPDVELRYLAPERQAGQPPSAAADIYAFGVLSGELFAGVLEGRDGTALSGSLERAMAAAPDDRFPTASDVAAAVRRSLLAPTSSVTGAPRPPPTRNPYKGLRAFEEADATDFFGREHLVQRLAERLVEPGDAARLLAVVGPSGSGKSSVVGAGLIPALRGGAIPGSEQWLIASLNPGERPFDKLEQALMSVAVDAHASVGQLLAARQGLGPLVSGILPGDEQLLLFIDQFEELFTLVQDDPTRRRFLQLLAATIDDPAARVHVLITLRADFYDRPLRHVRFGRQLAARTEAIPPLTPEELERVIVGPAERSGMQLETGLVSRMVAEMSDQPGGLPLLQYTLAELWERHDGHRLSLRAYEASGGIAAAVGRRAEQLVQGLDADGRETARQLFLRLVELGEGTPDTARRVATAELAALGAVRDQMESIIDAFARYRLLLLDRDAESRQPTLELAHEALLRAWPRLQQWVDEARDDLRQLRRLAAAAAQWLEAGRDPSFLLAGSRLEHAEQWATGTRVVLAAVEKEYLTASLAERRRLEVEDEQRRAHEAELERRAIGRLRALVVTLGLGALLAGALSIFAFGESQRARSEEARAEEQARVAGEQARMAEEQARVATARELAAASLANLDIDPERSILLALEAVELTRAADGTVLSEAEEALHRAVKTSRLVRTIPHGGYSLDITADGTTLATTGAEPADNAVAVWDIRSGQELRRFSTLTPGRPTLAFSPSDRSLATGHNDGSIRLWDADTGEQLQILRGHEDTVGYPAFSPDGRWLVSAALDDPTVRIWDVTAGAELMALTEPVEGWANPVFSPDGSRLATAAANYTVNIWDLTTSETIVRLEGHESFVNQTVFSPDGSRVATASADGTARVWDARSGEQLSIVFVPAALLSVAFSPDGSRIATSGGASSVAVWDAAAGRRLLALAGHGTDVTRLTFSPDGARLLTTSLDNTSRVWDISVAGGRDWLTVAGPAQRWVGVGFHPDGTRFAVPGDVDGVRIHDAASGAMLLTLGGHEATIEQLAFSPDGRLLAGAGSFTTNLAARQTIPVWDVDTGELLFQLEGHTASDVSAIAFSPDGRRLATAGGDDGTVRLWDAAGGEELLAITTGLDQVMRVAFSPEGQLVAASGVTFDLAWRFEVALFEADTGELVRLLEAHDHLAFGLQFAPDSRLVTASWDGTAKVWDIATGEVVSTLRHDTAPNEVAVSPDGARIATTAEDGTVRLWDRDTGRQVLTLYGHGDVAFSVAFSPDGRLLATSSPDGSVALYLLPIDEFVELARSRVTRDLTDDECRQYLHLDACAGR
jgi:WD40 repeat protein/DNA-binding SARP family transcriptional activator